MKPEDVVARLAGTADYLIDGLDIEDLEEIMAEAGYERCPECECWTEISELVDDESEPCPCGGCR